MYEYKVVTFRESLIGDALDSDKLEKTLNKHAVDGWGLKAITSADGAVTNESGFLEAKKRMEALYALPALSGGAAAPDAGPPPP